MWAHLVPILAFVGLVMTNPHKCVNPAKGPPGHILAVDMSFLSLRKRDRPLVADLSLPLPVRPKTLPILYFSLSSRWVNMHQHRPHNGPNVASRWANITPKMDQHSPKITQQWARIVLKIGQHSPNMSQYRPKIGRRPSKYPVLYNFFCCSHFSALSDKHSRRR